MPRKNSSSYGPMEGVDAAHRGTSDSATIRQTGFDAPKKKHVPTKTVTVREAAGKVADWVNSQMSKPAKKKKR